MLNKICYDVTSGGQLFHVLDAATGNALVANGLSTVQQVLESMAV